MIAYTAEQTDIRRYILAISPQHAGVDVTCHADIKPQFAKRLSDLQHELDILVSLAATEAKNEGAVTLQIKLGEIRTPPRNMVASVIGDDDLFRRRDAELDEMVARQRRH